MPGEWTFEFKYAKKESLKVRKYQDALKKIREEFEPQFAQMNPEEGNAEWTTRTDGKAPADNMFAKFTYKCTKQHLPQGSEHGTWTLLWNPKKADVKNHLHARCAPKLFKELSNKIQKQLVKECPGNFELNWSNGLDGYGYGNGGGAGHGFGGGGGGGHINMRQINRFLRQMNIAEQWSDSERCIHHLPWGYCEDCTDDVLDMVGYN